MRLSKLFQSTIPIALLMLIIFIGAQNADAKGKNGPQTVNASCLSLPARNYPVAGLGASYFQWEAGELYLDHHYIPFQIILSGQSADIDYLLSNFPAISANLLPIANSAVGINSGSTFNEMVLFETNLTTFDSLMQIYNVLLDPNVPALAVMAEPNRFVANPWGIGGDPWGIGGDPWGIGGDPWGIGGDPWGIGGDPWGISGDNIAAQENGLESRIMPLNQWALRDSTGIGLLDNNGQRVNPFMGKGVEVFVFDTTPYQTPDAYKLYGSHVCNYETALPVELGAPHELVKEHGLFSAGLVKMVAPYSDVHLLRVLNEAGFGDVFSVVAVMQDVLMAQHNAGTLDNTIFNLSLSITEFPLNTSAGQQLQVINQHINQIEQRLPSAYKQYVRGNDPIPALHHFTGQAEAQGITIVAATGNDSAENGLQPASLPAAYSSTIGVAASNTERKRSCFSNAPEQGAELLAPGGDGYGKECVNPFSLGNFRELCGGGFTSPYDCEYTIMSATSEGYGQWLGTSFSTPLTAGITALMVDLSNDIGCNATPDMIKYALVESAALNGLVVNVNDALQILQKIC